MARIEKGRIQISIVDLVRETEKLCGVDNAYSVIHMKKKVQEYFGDSIVLTEQDGKPSVLTFRDNVSSILHDFYTRVGKCDREEEKRSTAAQLIREDIKTLPSRDNYYPSADEIQSETSNANYVPHSLRIFLDSLISETDSSTKISAIGHDVIQATRPRGVIAPL